MGMILLPVGKIYGINYNESWKEKNQFIMPDSFYLYAIFNHQHEFLYAGFISFYMRCVYLQARSVYPRVRLVTICP